MIITQNLHTPVTLKNEFTKAFPPFLIYLATIIIFLSFFKDIVRVGFHLSWLFIRLGYLPFVLLTWQFAKRYLKTSCAYETPLWIAGLYITFLCTYFSFATGGIKSDYIYGLIQFYFGIAVMPITGVSFYFLSLTSISIYIGANLLKFGIQNIHDQTTLSNLVPLLVFAAVVYLITSKIRQSKINLQNELANTLIAQEEKINVQSKKYAETETKAALGMVAAQMAHDIRSPLAALNIVTEQLSQLPEELRLITREAITRINDIANNLLHKYKDNKRNSEISSTSELIAVALDEVISEKRLQYQKSNITFDYVIEQNAHGVFASIKLNEFKRVISNLINNAAEALQTSHVAIRIFVENGIIVIDIKDNGCGISEQNLKNLFQEGYTTKQTGSGLGLYHAREVLRSLNGDIVIQSVLQKGTTVSIKLPKTVYPKWFANEIRLLDTTHIVVIDDDFSIVKVWETRFAAFKNNVKLTHLNSIEKLGEWLTQNNHEKTVFLCDYEFAGHAENGLDALINFNISHQAYLVTSRYENHEIRSKCIINNLRIIPKGFSAFVPVVYGLDRCNGFSSTGYY